MRRKQRMWVEFQVSLRERDRTKKPITAPEAQKKGRSCFREALGVLAAAALQGQHKADRQAGTLEGIRDERLQKVMLWYVENAEKPEQTRQKRRRVAKKATSRSGTNFLALRTTHIVQSVVRRRALLSPCWEGRGAVGRRKGRSNRDTSMERQVRRRLALLA